MVIFFLLLCFCRASLESQTQSQVERPKDPKALLALAAQNNGLAERAMRPWHLMANLTRYDDTGAVADSGTYEEFWIAPHRYKIAYTTHKFAQTALRTEAGLFLSGDTGLPPEFLLLDIGEVLAPIASELPLSNLSTDKLILKRVQSGSIQLDCLTLKFERTSFGDLTGPSYCLSSDSDAIRAITNYNGMSQTLLNNVSVFQGHFVARELANIWNQKKRLSVQVTSLEALANSDAVEQTPPAGAAQASMSVEISARGSVDHAIKKVPPNYPVEAKRNHIQGTVVLKAHIDEHGKLSGLRPISGPTELQAAALKSVSQWQYKPYFLYGATSAVDTTINVIFTLGD